MYSFGDELVKASDGGLFLGNPTIGAPKSFGTEAIQSSNEELVVSYQQQCATIAVSR